MARQPFKANLSTGKLATVTFLAKYALATERDIPSFFADVGSIVNLQIKGIQPYGEKPETLIYKDMQASKKKSKSKPRKKECKANQEGFEGETSSRTVATEESWRKTE